MSALSPLLNSNLMYVPEEECMAISRYVGFAAGFHSQLYSACPSLLGQFRFFRDPDTDDIWSVCQTTLFSFGVQLDPDIQLICIWDAEWHDEIGTWIADPVAFAIEAIRGRYIQNA